MADETDPPLEDLTDADLGEPVEELRLLDHAPSPGFLARLRGAIRRRDLGSQLIGFGWSGFATVLLEFLKMIHALFQPHRPEKERNDVSSDT